MAGLISPSMPVWMLRNTVHGNRTFSNLNEGLGKVLRYGANSPDVLQKLKWMCDTLGPVLAKALAASGPIELKPLMGRAVHMGDEMHNRNMAASALLFKRLVPAILESGVSGGDAAAPAIVQFIGGTPALALESTLTMQHITLGRNNAFTLPPLDFAGTPAGIDVRKVVDTGIAPIINTGMAHKDAGVGQVGAGIVRPPMQCFTQAVAALSDALAETLQDPQ
jgi:hypothetical protein